MTSKAQPNTSAPPNPSGTPRRLSAQDILGCSNEAEIEHNGAIYRLRLTAQGKLILTK